jgi:SAM-dependent methyltransferase
MKMEPHKDYGFTDLYLKDTSDLAIWDKFRLEKIRNIFQTCSRIIDFGNSSRMLSELLSEDLKNKHKLHVDINSCFHPDLVADICRMPMFSDQSVDGIICASVLEHVYDPFSGAAELYRILKPGGKLFVYVPWMFAYHASTTGDVRDYVRFSHDSIRFLFSKFSTLELCAVRGRIETVLNLIPSLGKKSRFHRWFGRLVRKFDRYSNETASGFNVFAIK